MKIKYLLPKALFLSLSTKSQITNFNGFEARCLAAHYTKDEVFECNFKGTYYPVHIFDTTINKWFIKVVNGDSLFFHKSIREKRFIWNSSHPKTEPYGYELNYGGGSSMTIPDKYNGSDTLIRKEQNWHP